MKARRHRLAIGIVLTGLVGLIGLAGQTQPAPQASRRGSLKWGVYQILWSRQYEKHLAEGIAGFASPPDYIMFYRDLGRPYPRHAIDPIRKIGAIPMISLELWQWGRGQKDDFLQAVIDGRFDDAFTSWARDARADGKPVLLRFGFEFNGNWFPWSQRPAKLIEAWRHAHDIFEREMAKNVLWVWSPNVVSCPDVPENRMHLYYPGDAYVDYVSLDGYNFGENHDEYHHWQSFAEIYEDALDELARRYPHKPVIISEMGSAPGKADQRARWIREAYAFLLRRPHVHGIIWFNYDKRRENEPNWRIDATPGALQAFNETFAQKRG